jgi:hypothetical protein
MVEFDGAFREAAFVGKEAGVNVADRKGPDCPAVRTQFDPIEAILVGSGGVPNATALKERGRIRQRSEAGGLRERGFLLAAYLDSRIVVIGDH